MRALVLDGALDMSLSALDISLQQAQGFEQALATYFSWCGKAASNCSWTNGMQPKAAFDKLSASVEQKPLTGRVPVGPGEFLLGVIAPLYGGVDGFRILSQELAGAVRGDGSTIMSLVDSYTDRKSDGSYGNMQEANNAVNCIDAPAPDYMALRAEEPRFSMASPIFGTATLTGLFVCAHWPVHAQQERTPKASARFYRVVSSYCSGFALNELAPPASSATLRKKYPRVAAVSTHLEPQHLDEIFEFGLELQLEALTKARKAR